MQWRRETLVFDQSIEHCLTNSESVQYSSQPQQFSFRFHGLILLQSIPPLRTKTHSFHMVFKECKTFIPISVWDTLIYPR